MRSDQTPRAEGEPPEGDAPNGDATPSQAPDSNATKAAAPIEVDVARTGGFAGMTRHWTAQPPPEKASEWISLLDRCPWDEAPAPSTGEPVTPSPIAADRDPVPDGFVWWIRASWSGAFTKEAELPDDAITGAWRELVDAVREWGRRDEGPESRER
ncbi:hypothetical protein K0817_012790 [Microbacterium sp. HD4P20]|uniref:protealysin inhibitor emfourin n=1 Tax=Microbacterium sp. HD4P20 TaxID=2864874 RepID=UPI0020A60953|nr:protealysin inhibitor emfourin [Microbacterium sp. HD4P20]MCP2637432.1 hypothetical protein [Microbacterium sp. HD4P20]